MADPARRLLFGKTGAECLLIAPEPATGLDLVVSLAEHVNETGRAIQAVAGMAGFWIRGVPRQAYVVWQMTTLYPAPVQITTAFN